MEQWNICVQQEKECNKFIAGVNIQCFVKQSHCGFSDVWLLIPLDFKPTNSYAAYLGMPKIAKRLEVYSAPTRKLHQLTNILITYHLSQYPNPTSGLVHSCAFGDFKVVRTNMLGIECMKFLVYQTKKRCHHVVCILNDFWDFPGDSGIRNRPANAGDEGSMPGPGNSHMLWSH